MVKVNIETDKSEKISINLNKIKYSFYELSEELYEKEIPFPNYYNIITNDKRLEINEEIELKENQEIKIVDVESLEADIRLETVDVINYKPGPINLYNIGNIEEIKSRKNGEKHWKPNKGINLIGFCENKKCKVCGKKVIQYIYDFKLDLTKINGKMKCPICKESCDVNNIGFFNCYYHIYGTQFNSKTDTMEPFNEEIPHFENAAIKNDPFVKIKDKKIKVNKTPNNKLILFNESGDKILYMKFIIQVKKFKD